MTDQPYKRPPITEAVIEIRIDGPVDENVLLHVSNKFLELYPNVQPMRNMGVAVDLSEASDNKTIVKMSNQASFRRSSEDETEILVLSPENLIISQLAPYPGWGAFTQRFYRDFELWRRLVQYRKIARLGVRFINRIDFPLHGHVADESNYLNIGPRLPDAFGILSGYHVAVQLRLQEIGAIATVNTASVFSPLIGHGALLLDVDIGREKDVPQSSASMSELLDSIRLKKNEIFESCVTDKARELFGK